MLEALLIYKFDDELISILANREIRRCRRNINKKGKTKYFGNKLK